MVDGMVDGIVLAAGFSTRMGRAKALLTDPATGESFVASVARALLDGGAATAIVVGRPEDATLRDTVTGLGASVRFVANHDASRGQLSSLVAALDAIDARVTRAAIVMPVDLPRVRATTVAALIGAFLSGTYHIARATFKGRHGHPVLFDRLLFDELRRADPAAGARAVVHARAVLDVEVDDPGVLHDVDTPEDYERLMRTDRFDVGNTGSTRGA